MTGKWPSSGHLPCHRLSAPEADQFLELDRAKRIALDCAREVLWITVGDLSHIIPHHSKEAKRLKARLTLLRVVRREIHAGKELGGVWPSRAMRIAQGLGRGPRPAAGRLRDAQGTMAGTESGVDD